MKSRPRTGSLQFRPRKRAKKETPSFGSFPKLKGKTKPMNFFGYKAGMLHVFVKNETPKTTSFGQEIALPATLLECPPLKVFGIRAYAENENGFGTRVLTEVNAEKTEKHLQRKIHSFKKKKSREEKGKEKTGTKNETGKTMADLEKMKNEITELRLLVHTQPHLMNFGKKKPEISEIGLNGSMEEQLVFAKEQLGKTIAVQDVFEGGQMMDVKAVTKGKGFEGVIKRHRVKMQRHKAKKIRAVGAISPWHPPTVMWTVARPGQMGYHARTEFNKQVLEIGNAGKKLSPPAGFPHYGTVQNDFVIVLGSVPGPAKRCIGLRHAMRNTNGTQKLGAITHYSTVIQKGKEMEEEMPKLQKVKVETEKKAEHKSVQEELSEAAKTK
jgi:large subunit ribosomal protein L3